CWRQAAAPMSPRMTLCKRIRVATLDRAFMRHQPLSLDSIGVVCEVGYMPIVTSQAAGRRQRTEPRRDGLNRLIVEGLRHAAHDEVVGGVMRQVLVKAREPRNEI